MTLGFCTRAATVSTLDPSNPVVWYPTGKQQRVLRAKDCDHCEQENCARKCLARIQPDEVLAQMEELLKTC